MPRKPLSTKRRNSVIDYVTVKKGTVTEAAEHFGFSRAYIYEILKDHEESLTAFEKQKPVAAYNDPSVFISGKLTCRCFFCHRKYFRVRNDGISSFICSEACYKNLETRPHEKQAFHMTEEDFAIQIPRALARVKRLNEFFAFKKPESVNLGVVEETEPE
jgi:hypothetical protein